MFWSIWSTAWWSGYKELLHSWRQLIFTGWSQYQPFGSKMGNRWWGRLHIRWLDSYYCSQLLDTECMIVDYHKAIHSRSLLQTACCWVFFCYQLYFYVSVQELIELVELAREYVRPNQSRQLSYLTLATPNKLWSYQDFYVVEGHDTSSMFI